MRQRFFTKTIQSDFIKSLLYNTPLPIYKAVQIGDYLIQGNTYIFNRSLIKCSSSGYLCKPFQRLQYFSSSILGEFILGQSRLNDNSFMPSKVTSGSYIQQGVYYLLGEYDLNYNLQPSDPPYPMFNESLSYSVGDTVCHQAENLKYYLYHALESISPGSWNQQQWQYIPSSKNPYYLIKATVSGIIDQVPYSASYEILQEFEPLLISDSNTDIELSPDTYYCIYETSLGQSCLVYNENLPVITDQVATWVNYDSYVPEKYYTTYTYKFHSDTDYYDSETHRKLGELLRFYKNVYNLNLLPYYNCWDGSYLINYQIYNGELVKTSGTTYKLLKIPIKFNTEYTVAIDCDSRVDIIPVLIKANDFLKVQVGQSNQILLNSLLDNFSVQTLSSTSFHKPFLFQINNKSTELLSSIEPSVVNNTLTKAEFLQRYEDNLYLIIQLPLENNSSIVVLEGDYRTTYIDSVFNINNISQISSDNLNQILTSSLSLLQLNDKITYPFSDRLIEYLLQNVITEQDWIGEDIIRVRNALSGYLHYDTNSVAWSDYLRITIFDLLMSSYKQTQQDLSGYVDKDAETYLNTL